MAKVDLDRQLTGGCFLVAISNIVVFALCVWPWLVVKDYDPTGIALVCALGMIPAILVGVLLIRRFEAAGLCGFMGGACCFGIFTYLRLGQLVFGQSEADVSHTPLHSSVVFWLPLAWMVLTIGISVLVYPKRSEMG